LTIDDTLRSQITSDFGSGIAEKILEEIDKSNGKCFYDSNIKKVVYYNLQDAFCTYMKMQVQEAEKHRWIESEKAHADLGNAVETGWVVKYGKDFRNYWRKTHSFVLPENNHQNSFHLEQLT